MQERRHIRVLPDHVANKIAAGEVVDRPASVVKELVENALDSGAARIDVEVVAGGRKLIAVGDDGPGMTRDDALLSIERHATSKILDADDIERVGTLGFRGEALAAIAAVSQFTLATRPADALAGTEIIVSGGRIQDVRDAGCAPGTRVAVRNLFFNIPARRKFLRSEQTELAHVRQTFLVYALAYPAIGFRLVVDEREVYRLPAAASPDDRVRELLGSDVLKALRPVDFSQAEVTVRGYAGLPQGARADRSEQYIFVNRRPAAAPVLGFAVAEAYHTLLPRGKYPVLCLHIEMDPSLVDVNVHPAKKEVRFRDPSAVRDALIAALRTALAVPAQAGSPVQGIGPAPVPPPEQAALVSIPDMPRLRTFAYPRLPMVPAGGPAEEPAAASAGAPAPAAGGDERRGPWSWCRVLGQVGGLYVVLETEDGVVLMDPHAAHERILFERYMGDVIEHKVESQGLLSPETVELTPQHTPRIRANLELLRHMGFGVSEFGGDAFLVDSMPSYFGGASAADLLAAVAATLEQAGRGGGTERWAEESIAQAACKAAVKARDRLTVEEIERLVVDLAGTAMPYTCPHGRPTLIFMGFQELHRKFGRA